MAAPVLGGPEVVRVVCFTAAAQHRGSSGYPRSPRGELGRVDCGDHQNRSRSHYGMTHTRPLLLNV